MKDLRERATKWRPGGQIHRTVRTPATTVSCPSLGPTGRLRTEDTGKNEVILVGTLSAPHPGQVAQVRRDGMEAVPYNDSPAGTGSW